MFAPFSNMSHGVHDIFLVVVVIAVGVTVFLTTSSDSMPFLGGAVSKLQLFS